MDNQKFTATRCWVKHPFEVCPQVQEHVRIKIPDSEVCGMSSGSESSTNDTRGWPTTTSDRRFEANPSGCRFFLLSSEQPAATIFVRVSMKCPYEKGQVAL
ncbi:hypothetical protein AVEN_40781-1 [Araneus ventricosus]|uniref:Uncharacterized protein n=1 Tax=Araneus ventricosus TaxID=182803 RepID=A0A4Y2UJ27_ARAVE|nr:hypothetical protein AVEN_40781-1 [Araneus ventricosus]